MFYCDSLKEVYIQNLNGNYVLNQFGLYRISTVTTGILVTDTKIFKLNTFDDGQTTNGFTSSKLDFNIGGDKTISEIYIQDSSTGTKYARGTLYKNGNSYESPFKLVNENGVGYPHLTGNVMSISYKNENYSKGEISNIHIQTIRVDGRSGLGYTGGQQ